MRNLGDFTPLPLQNFLNIALEFRRQDCGAFKSMAAKHCRTPHRLSVLDRNVAPLHAELLHEIIPRSLVLRLLGLRCRCNICSTSTIIAMALRERRAAGIVIHGLHTCGLGSIEPR
ncbi:hypothetical protein ATE59_15345 [Sphingopyxis sp. A083]|nr:hypothetical protein ATE59_15345 [Sphingopyxis sp. A083]